MSGPNSYTAAGTCLGCMIELSVRRDFGSQGVEYLKAAIAGAVSEKQATLKWRPVSEKPENNKPGTWIIKNGAGRVSVTQNLPSWWNHKDERGGEYDGPEVVEFMEVPE